MTSATQVEWGPVAVWTGALTTLLAVIVALLAGLGWFARRHRPLLRVTFEQAQPWCRQVESGHESAVLWVRVAVENDGKDPARGCVGRLAGLATEGAPRSDIDPVQLRWAGIPRSRSFEPVDLRRGQREFLNVVFKPDGEGWVIDTFGDSDFDPGFATTLRADLAHVLQIAVFADNADTRTLGMRIEVTATGPKITASAAG